MGGSPSEGTFAVSFLGLSWCKPEGCCRPLTGRKFEFVERKDEELVGVFVEGGPCYLEARPPELDEDGDLYAGQWIGAVKHGHGRLVRKDIGSYVGQFVQGQVKGQGRLEMDSGDSYDGQWQNGTMHGLGKYTYSNGSSHEGQFVQGGKHGFGQENLADSSKFEGQFIDGRRHGRGKYSSVDGSTFEGQFHNDMMEGKGRYRFVGGKVYDGHWLKSRMHGPGRMDWPDGRRYEGSFEADRKSGPGKFTWADGSSYDGQWYMGRQHGHGVHIDAWGQQASGKWIAGRRMNMRDGDAPSSSNVDPPSSSASSVGVKRLGSAPFKAIGSLFGRHSSHDSSASKLHSEKLKHDRLHNSTHSLHDQTAASHGRAGSKGSGGSWHDHIHLPRGRAGSKGSSHTQDSHKTLHSDRGSQASEDEDSPSCGSVARRPSTRANLASIVSRCHNEGEEDFTIDGLEVPGSSGAPCSGGSGGHLQGARVSN